MFLVCKASRPHVIRFTRPNQGQGCSGFLLSGLGALRFFFCTIGSFDVDPLFASYCNLTHLLDGPLSKTKDSFTVNGGSARTIM